MDNKFVLSQSFNDLVFEKRHKKYGAYDIRRKYGRFALLACGCAILFFTTGSLTWAYVESPEREHKYMSETINVLPDVPPVNHPNEIKDPPKPKTVDVVPSAAEKGPKTQALTSVIEITNEADSMPPPGNLEAGKDPGGVVGGSGSGPGNNNKVDTTPTTPPVPKIVEWSNHPPTCPTLDAYLAKNIRYPDNCREMGIEGTVYVQFIVDTKGDYRDVQVVKGPNPAMNQEALRVMSTMPKWTPATDDNGVLVEYIMRKPIRFELTK